MMNHKLFLIEGLPGTGKTTLAEKISEYLSISMQTNLYLEGDLHPADLAWCACVPIQALDDIFRRYPGYENAIRSNMYIEDRYAIIAYTRFQIEEVELFKLFESYEVYDNRAGFEAFRDLHLKRWHRFAMAAESAQQGNVFECSYLQNHINELLLFHNLGEPAICAYLTDLIKPVLCLNPVLFYLDQPDVKETLLRVSAVRINQNGDKVWMDRVIEYIEKCPYGEYHHLKGFEGLVQAFEARKQIELKVMGMLPIPVYRIKNDSCNWNEVWNDIQQILISMKLNGTPVEQQ